MDVNQLEKLVQFFDEERRKDRTQLLQLQERVETLLRENEVRSRYAQALETQIADLKSRVSRAEGWTSAIDSARQEFKINIQRVDESVRRTDVDAQRVRQVELESVTRQLAELRREVKPYAAFAEAIEARKLEDMRLSEMIGRLQVQATDLERRLEQPGNAISYLEEQRRQDAKRIVGVEQELPEIKRRIEQLPPQLLLLDEAVRRKHTEIEEAAKLLEAQSQVIETQRVSDIRRERQFAEYAEVVERTKQRADEISSQTVGFIQMREEVKRELTALPDFERRVEARIGEVFELQRDAEERAKRQAETFRDQIEKHWADFVVQQEEKWHERDRRLTETDGRFDEIEEELTRIPTLTPIFEIIEAMAKSQAANSREWLAQTNQWLDRVKLNQTSDVKLSRRQRRKVAVQKAQETGREVEIDVPPEDADLLR